MPGRLFDLLAREYDQWFESESGRPIFELEVKCLRGLFGSSGGRNLEVGVGTGRFAAALGIRDGVDISGAMLTFACGRKIRVCRASASLLPYFEGVFDELVMVVTICFLDAPDAALRECRRVLRPGGGLVVGLVPADGAWGRLYAGKARKGHRFYANARFYTCAQVIAMAGRAGFELDRAASTLFNGPDEKPDSCITGSVSEQAGFVAMRFA